MALPKWITPEGNLGTVPELDFYLFPLEVNDPSGGTIEFSRVSGRLPPGIQVVRTGALQGVPISEQTGDKNIEYTFTVRARNTSTNKVVDRTFSITVTNVLPPVIIPRNVYLGLYLDGTEVQQQLVAVEQTPGATLVWRVKSGELPPGLTLTSSGLLIGYVEPIPDPTPGTKPGWDATAWNFLGWDFSERAISKTFIFTVEVTDGVNSDLSTYTLRVFPRSSLTADNDELPVDTTTLETGVGLSIDYGSLHNPIITTVQSDIPPARQGSYFSFNVDAFDLDGDILQYSVPVIASGAFDEQTLVGNSIPYVADLPINGNLFTGAWPSVQSTLLTDNTISTSSTDPTTAELQPGDQIKVLTDNPLTAEDTPVWYNATVNNHSRLRLYGNTILTGNVGDTVTQTLQPSSTANLVAIGTTFGNIRVTGNIIVANVGDYITQPSSGANATITSKAVGTEAQVVFNSGTFVTGSGNIYVNGTDANVYPTSINCLTDIDIYYTGTLDTYTIGSNLFPISFNGNTTGQYPISVQSVGVSVGSLATEGTIGFDEGRFDQGELALPGGLSIDIGSGWITGRLPAQTIDQITYDFEVAVYKLNDPTYRDSQIYTLTVLGDLYNRIDWITDSDLGTIENGKVSDLEVVAESTRGKPLIYKLSAGGQHRLPQGLILQNTGLISGRVSFEIFSLDSSLTTIDGGRTTFDNTYSFTVTATDYNETISADRTFTLRVVIGNTRPYEDLYLKALLSIQQRLIYNNLINNQSIFPTESIYRISDPFFGASKELKTLFLPGLDPSTLSQYMNAVDTNHYKKRLELGEIKTAVALDSNFDTKYEVVYVEVKDENTSAAGFGPQNTIDLASIITTPYYDSQGNSYNIVYPNAFDNMSSVVVNKLGYANKGALPDWMTSRQPNGRVLGFTRAVVLAYVNPGESAKIAYRLKAENFDFNQLDFTVDRYLVDNVYSDNYDITANSFINASETTFDRYPNLSGTFIDQGTVDYALDVSFDSINQRPVSLILSEFNGIDGFKNFQDGQTLVFATQEFFRSQEDTGEYNQGWNRVTTIWDGDPWAYDTNLLDNPYVLTVGWSANTQFYSGYTILNSGFPYRVNEDFMSGSSFAIFDIYFGVFDSDDYVFDAIGFDAEDSVPNMTAMPVSSQSGLTPGIGWDQAEYVPGYEEYLNGTSYPNGSTGFPASPANGDLFTYNDILYVFMSSTNLWRVTNQRAGIWRINIDNENIVTLSFVAAVGLNDKLYVRKGFTYGGTNIYFDPAVKAGLLYPNYSIIPQQIRTTYTTFDGNGTRFFSNRDSYTVPGSNDKYIKFPKIGVFT